VKIYFQLTQNINADVALLWTVELQFQYSLCTGPMVDLMCNDFTFCQCFFSKETRKFMAR